MKKRISKIVMLLMVLMLATCNCFPGAQMTVHAANDDGMDGIRGFVSRMYTVALGRSAEAEGLEYWSNLLASKNSDGANIAYGFIMSEEFINKNLSNAEYLDVLYRTFFDREADQGGMDYWMNLLNTGTSRGTVLAGFVNSVEFSDLCNEFGILRGYMYRSGLAANPGIAQFVYRLYNVALGREGEADGINYWTEKIAEKVWSAEAVATTGFFESPELQNRNLSNRAFVDVLYATFFDRPGEETGIAYWIQNLENGMSRRDVVFGFSRSAEFMEILKKYGLYEEKKIIHLLKTADVTRYGYDEWSGATVDKGHIECVYDEKGNILTKTQTSDSWFMGDYVGYYTYDAQGRLIKEIYYGGNGVVVDSVNFCNDDVFDIHRWTEYEYDARGNVSKYVKYNADKSIWEAVENTYDENNNLIKEKYSDTFWYESYYNEFNKLTAKYCYSNGKRSTSVTKKYDSEGYLTEVWGYVSMTGGFPITYYNREGKPTHTAYRDRNNNIISDMYDEYDAYGNIVKEVNGSDVTIYQYTYDEQGNMTSVLYENGDYNVYAYDAYGNCIREARYSENQLFYLFEQTYVSFEVSVNDK